MAPASSIALSLRTTPNVISSITAQWISLKKVDQCGLVKHVHLQWFDITSRLHRLYGLNHLEPNFQGPNKMMQKIRAAKAIAVHCVLNEELSPRMARLPWWMLPLVHVEGMITI